MSWNNSTKFKLLKTKWYKKLEATGFKDIELEGPQNFLRAHGTHSDFGQRIGFKKLEFFEAIRDYYYWAEDMANHGKFNNAEDRKIWTLHAHGKSSRDIAECVPSSQPTICRKIKKIREYLKLQNRIKGTG